MDTLGSLKTSCLRWLDETVDDEIVNDAISDAIESLWKSAMQASPDLFMAGPLTVAIAASIEGVIIVSVADPTTAPTLTDVVAGALASHAIVAAYTLVTESGTETLISSTATRTVPINNVCSVATPAFVEGAIGWNCYMGDPAGRLAKQNDAPIRFGDAFEESTNGFANEPQLPSPPTENTTGDDIFMIRHLEMQMPNGGYRAYDGADLDSLMMRRMSRSTPAASEYQTYYWTLLNQRQLETRPATGTALTFRYWYTKRPRRLRFDNSPLPFLTFPSLAFLRNHALSALFLHCKEFDTALAFDTKAEAERQSAVLSIAQMSHTKNQWILPAI